MLRDTIFSCILDELRDILNANLKKILLKKGTNKLIFVPRNENYNNNIMLESFIIVAI